MGGLDLVDGSKLMIGLVRQGIFDGPEPGAGIRHRNLRLPLGTVRPGPLGRLFVRSDLVTLCFPAGGLARRFCFVLAPHRSDLASPGCRLALVRHLGGVAFEPGAHPVPDGGVEADVHHGELLIQRRVGVRGLELLP